MGLAVARGFKFYFKILCYLVGTFVVVVFCTLSILVQKNSIYIINLYIFHTIIKEIGINLK